MDVITTHLHPLWNGASVDSAVIWVAAHHEEARTLHPDRPVIVGEAGWATAHDQQGDQGRLMRGAVGEAEQARVVADLAAWTARTRVPTLLFEAFDERWKGGDDPTDAEKHWGVFHADRTPKPVFSRLGEFIAQAHKPPADDLLPAGLYESTENNAEPHEVCVLGGWRRDTPAAP